MISCLLQGGLGNQMFQIATTHALALRNNDIAVFNLDNCHTPQQGYTSKKYKNNIFKKINVSDSFIYSTIYREPKFSYSEIPYKNGMTLLGYFQSEKYFEDFKVEIKELFSISTEDINIIKEFLINNNFQSNKTLTSVHIRRGDYLINQNYHQPCNINYYNSAIKEINSDYYVFVSDDIKWVKENFKADNFIYSNLNSEILDLTLMCVSNNNIISNSSFSWWGAYLNINENKRIIAPQKWFGPNGPSDTQDIIPNTWETIDNLK